MLCGCAQVNLAEIHLLYIAYSGWIYTGRSARLTTLLKHLSNFLDITCDNLFALFCRPGWSIDQLTISNGLGLKLSYCKDTGELLPSGIPVAR